MNNLTLLDEKFDSSKTMSYHISIQLSLNGYSFAILDNVESRYIVLKHINFPKPYSLKDSTNENSFYDKIKEILREDEFLNKDYRSVKLIFETQKSTIVPSELFEITKLKSYFDFNHVLEENESVNYAKLSNINAYCVFALPSFLTTILVNKYRNIKFYQQSNPYIEYINNRTYRIRNAANQKRVYVNVSNGFFDIYVADAKNLLLHNCYSYQGDTDFAYYVLNTYEQLGLNPEFDEIYLSGIIGVKDSLIELLKKYIKFVKYMKLNTVFKYSRTFNEIPEHSFVNLFNLYSCV